MKYLLHIYNFVFYLGRSHKKASLQTSGSRRAVSLTPRLHCVMLLGGGSIATLRHFKNVPCRREKPLNSVSAVLNNLGWESLQARRFHHRLSRITSRLLEYHPTPCYQTTTRGHSKQFQCFWPEVDAFKYAFLPRTIPAWNAIPSEVMEADSLDLFKQHLTVLTGFVHNIH